MKYLKSVLPYYLNHGLKTNEGQLIGITDWVGICGIFKDHYGERHVPVSAIMPHLLPLSALTEPLEDGTIPIVELAKIAMNCIWGDLVDFSKAETFLDGDSAGVVVFYGEERNSFTADFDSTRKEFRLMSDGDDMTLNQLQLFEYLFANHFDAFGLIASGQAIDKRTVK